MFSAARPILTERNWSVLGLLRFVLAVSVMICHLSAAIGLHHWLFFFGGFGPVCGFFMISGFCIAAALSRTTDKYYERRIRRIYPLSVTAVFLTVIVVYLVSPGPTANGLSLKSFSFFEVFATLFLLNGLVIATPLFLGPLWTLNCEMMYYLLAPMIRNLSAPKITVIACLSCFLFVALFITHPLFNYPLATGGLSFFSLYWVWLLGFLFLYISEK